MYHIISQTQDLFDIDKRSSISNAANNVNTPDGYLEEHLGNLVLRDIPAQQSQSHTGQSKQVLEQKKPKVLMDVASVKEINQMITKEMASFKQNRIVNQSEIDLTLQWSKTWANAMKQQKKKRKRPMYVSKKKRIKCTKRVRSKRARFYKKYHDVSGKAKPISHQLYDPELTGDPNMEDYIDDFDVNQFI